MSFGPMTVGWLLDHWTIAQYVRLPVQPCLEPIPAAWTRGWVHPGKVCCRVKVVESYFDGSPEHSGLNNPEIWRHCDLFRTDFATKLHKWSSSDKISNKEPSGNCNTVSRIFCRDVTVHHPVNAVYGKTWWSLHCGIWKKNQCSQIQISLKEQNHLMLAPVSVTKHIERSVVMWRYKLLTAP